MSLDRIPELRKISIATVIGTSAFLILASIYPLSRFLLAILFIVVYSVPFVFWMYVVPRRNRGRTVRRIWVRELTPEMIRAWYAEGRITQEDLERMMRDVSSRTPDSHTEN